MTATFDATAAQLHTVACHLVGGDQRAAEQLLTDTYLHLQQHPDDRALLAMHRLFVRQPFTAAAVGPAMVLSPVERAVVSLIDVESASIADVAAAMGMDAAGVVLALESGRGHLGGATAADAMRSSEAWLDDTTRDRVRDRLERTDPAPASIPHRAGRATYAVAAALVMIVAACVAVVVAGRASDHRASSSTTTTTTTTPASPVAPLAIGISSGDSSLSLPVIAGATGDVDIISLATGLTDVEPVRPDSIVRFSNGKVGLAWDGPCNRPAVAAEFALTRTGPVVALLTGAFPVVSCVGMPTRWTAVLSPPTAELGTGRIVPEMTGSGLAVPFLGYSEALAVTSNSPLHENGGAAYGSALIDGASQPWAFVRDCERVDRIQYATTGGPMFEVRVDPAAGQCSTLAAAPRLMGTRGWSFPYTPHQDGGNTGVPARCAGPVGSATDLAGSTSVILDGVAATTWDGCLVRSDVMKVTDLSSSCFAGNVRTVTFAATIGARIDPAAAQTFIDDPGGVVHDVATRLRANVQLPATAIDTGLRLGLQPLWLSPSSADDALYVITADGTQRWPRYDGVLPDGCLAHSGTAADAS